MRRFVRLRALLLALVLVISCALTSPALVARAEEAAKTGVVNVSDNLRVRPSAGTSDAA